MTLFLTSKTGPSYFNGERWTVAPFYAENGFRAAVQARWPEEARVLLIASDPDGTEINDEMLASTVQAMEDSGLPVAEAAMLDRRNQDEAAAFIRESGVIQLCGGHVPTQNEFFREIGLADLLRDFDGIVIGISAGSMNSGKLVYAQPEEEGEALDPDYPRYMDGLGLADITLLPHFQELPGTVLDGLDIITEISLPDSFFHPFFAIPDGSYFLVEDGRAMLFGEGYWFENGEIERVCEDGESLEI